MEPRQATPADSTEVVRLAGLMFESMGHHLTEEWQLAAQAQFEAHLGPDLVAFVVDDPTQAGRLRASGCGLIHGRLASPINTTGRVGYIQWVCTDPSARRQGHAIRIMTCLLDWYQTSGVPVVELHATPDGEPVYRRLGFGQNGGVALRRRAWDWPDETDEGLGA